MSGDLKAIIDNNILPSRKIEDIIDEVAELLELPGEESYKKARFLIEELGDRIGESNEAVVSLRWELHDML